MKATSVIFLLFILSSLSYGCEKEKAFASVADIKVAHFTREMDENDCDNNPEVPDCVELREGLLGAQDLLGVVEKHYYMMCDPPCDRGKEGEAPIPLSQSCLVYQDRGQTVNITFLRNGQPVGVCEQTNSMTFGDETYIMCCMTASTTSTSKGPGMIEVVVEEQFPGEEMEEYRSLLTNNMIIL